MKFFLFFAYSKGIGIGLELLDNIEYFLIAIASKTPSPALMIHLKVGFL